MSRGVPSPSDGRLQAALSAACGPYLEICPFHWSRVREEEEGEGLCPSPGTASPARTQGTPGTLGTPCTRRPPWYRYG